MKKLHKAHINTEVLMGWTVSFDQVKEIQGKVCDRGYIMDMEQVEAVIVAMVDLGYIKFSK